VEHDDRPTKALTAPRVQPDEEITAVDPVVELPLGPGIDIGGYILDEQIGKGGMGVVYSASHPVIGKRAAIKVLQSDVSKSPIMVERFTQEARAVNQIGHPNIIDIFAFGALPDGRAYHIMDLLVGESLRQRLRRGPLHPSEAASVIDELVSALIAAHDKGFVHRDLKPDNVFLVAREGRWPEVKLLDFGLAKLMPEGGMSPFQTTTGIVLGTPEYMSPEQARGIGVDYRTDIYALGVMTFEIITGHRPFPKLDDAMAMLMAHAAERPPPLATLAPQLPLEMSQLVDAMLAKTPDDRPSLLAVRTVIKRLRSTLLPTHTAAGLEISLSGIAAAPPPESGVLSAASLESQMTTELARRPSVPPVIDPAPAPHLAGPSPRAPSIPPTSVQPTAILPTVVPPSEVPPTAVPQAAYPRPPSANPSLPPHRSYPPGSSLAPSLSTHGGQRASGPMTSLVPQDAQQEHAAPALGAGLQILPQMPLRVPGPTTRSSRGWLVVGALVAIAAGVALAIMLVGT